MVWPLGWEKASETERDRERGQVWRVRSSINCIWNWVKQHPSHSSTVSGSTTSYFELSLPVFLLKVNDYDRHGSLVRILRGGGGETSCPWSSAHTTLRPPLPRSNPVLGSGQNKQFGFYILDWVFFPLLLRIFFSFSCSFLVFQDQIGFLRVFAFFLPTRFSRGKLTTHDSFLHYCLPHSPELENRLTRSWQRETRLERKHGSLAVLHGHGALF